MFVVDTNLLVYAARGSAPEHNTALAHLEACRRGRESWRVSWSIVYEFLRVATHSAVSAPPLTLAEAWSFLAGLWASPTFGVLCETDRHAEVIRDLTVRCPRLRGNLVHNLHIAALMLEHSVRAIHTADADFRRFAFLDVMNPLE